MMMLSTHPSTGGPFSVVPSPFNCVSNVGFADLDLEVQNALHAFVFKGDLFDPVAEQARAIGLVDEIGTLDEVVAKNFNAKAYDFQPEQARLRGADVGVPRIFSGPKPKYYNYLGAPDSLVG
jgi:hypothetical protein